MRILIAAVLFPVTLALAAEPPDALDTARRLAAAGAAQLALDRVARSQPRDPAGTAWREWEALRFELLDRLGRHEDVLARVAALPPVLAPEQMRDVNRMAVRAAVALGRGSDTRRYAARLLWQHETSADDLRELRLRVIDSYVIDGRGEEAYLAMLKFEQDYRPLERPVAARFVHGLIDLNMARQAVNWLASLDDAGALKLRLRLKAGLIDAAGALVQARALAARDGGIDAWRVIAEVALKQNDLVPYVEALERVLQALEAKPGRVAARTHELWQAYEALARETANRNQLLVGDYAAWGDFGARRLETSPVVARAFFGLLSRLASVPEIRDNAQYQLVASLRAASLGRAALRLFGHPALADAPTDPQARYALGDIAESVNEPAIALRYWQDLPPPAGVGAEWPFRVAAVAVLSGKPDAATAAVKRALAGKRELAPELVQRAVQVVQDMLAAGRLDDAEALFDALLPLAEPGQRRQILLGLARINDATGQWPAAADYYLRSAVLADPKGPDALAVQARLGGALALARAGYATDARAQFEWLVKHAKDPVQVDIARRELAKLKR